MVIDDSVVRASIKVARSLGLGGLSTEAPAAGPLRVIDPEAKAADDWLTQTGDGTIRRLSLDVGQVNAAFAALPDQRAAERPEEGPADATFIDLYATLVSIPGIGASLLEPGEKAAIDAWLKPGTAPFCWLPEAAIPSRARAMCAAASSTGCISFRATYPSASATRTTSVQARWPLPERRS
ncbi:hypothetical protein V6L77_06675 [Pannonibacter sp. Pt2-lr]